MKKFTVSVLAIAALAGSAAAQTFPVRMEVRIVPQTGTPPATVTDGPLTTPATPITISGTERTQRFEMQYRILDLDLSDSIFPAGLTAAEIDITVNNPASGSFARAQLSRFEAQLAGTIPPTSTDSSGLPTGAAAGRAGLHSPYRGGLSNANDNTLPANGTPDTRAGVVGIFSVLPLAISQTNQGNPDVGSPNDSWFGLYSFTFTADDNFTGDVIITAAPKADPNTMNSFGYFNDGVAVPLTSPNSVNGVAHLSIVAVPAPGAAALVGLGGLVAFRRRRA
ncbi:MAG: hypothetical protein ACK4WH_14850 [Phycisphaerales bacterium]